LLQSPDEFLTTDTWATDIESPVRIYAALHCGEAEPEDRCVSLAVGQSAVTFEADVARELGAMLLRAADALEEIETRSLDDETGADDYDIVAVIL
jgi:hypothetical protein